MTENFIYKFIGISLYACGCLVFLYTYSRYVNIYELRHVGISLIIMNSSNIIKSFLLILFFNIGAIVGIILNNISLFIYLLILFATDFITIKIK
jgi:hypothetical protein